MSHQTSDAEEQSKPRTLPSFVKKLWIIVNDQETNQLIWWAAKGKSILIPDASAFSRSVLPRHFKHSNWQSFVRQLNLYGFRKVSDADLLDQNRSSTQDGWQFRHENFQKNCAHLLHNIKRKRNQNKSVDVLAGAASTALAASTPYSIPHSRPTSWSPTSSSSHPPYPIQQYDGVGERITKLTDTLLELEERSARIQYTVTELREAQQQQHEVMKSLMPLIKMLLHRPHRIENSGNSNRHRAQLYQKLGKLQHQLMDHTNLLGSLQDDDCSSMASAVATETATATGSSASMSATTTPNVGNNSSTAYPHPNTLPPIQTTRFERPSSLLSPNRVVLPPIATPTHLPAIRKNSFYRQSI